MAAKIALVAAMAKNRVIGKDGGLPWRLPEDLKHFKRVTMGHPVVMGRKTYESIGRPLPGRDNIIITRSADFSADGAHVESSVDAGLTRAAALAADGGGWVMVIGGGEIYRQTIGRADRLYLTEIDAEVDGDTVFPAFDAAAFTETERTELPPGPDGAPGCAFAAFERVRAA